MIEALEYGWQYLILSHSEIDTGIGHDRDIDISHDGAKHNDRNKLERNAAKHESGNIGRDGSGMLQAGKAEHFVIRIIDAQINKQNDGDAEKDGAGHCAAGIGDVVAEIHGLLVTTVTEEDRDEAHAECLEHIGGREMERGAYFMRMRATNKKDSGDQ